MFPEIERIPFKRHMDDRGFFSEMYRKKGHPLECVQLNHSFSKKGGIRGMHFQTTPGQAKLITVIRGIIYDVFVDIRLDSPTFGKWDAVELDAKRPEQLYIPIGFAHGFAVLSDEAHLIYQVSSFYHPDTEKSFRFDDPTIGIEWPIENPVLSKKDHHAPTFKEVFA